MSNMIRNKREVIGLCLSRLHDLDSVTDPITRHYALISIYYDCKDAAASAGYADSCFDALWHRAVDQHARELDVFTKVV